MRPWQDTHPTPALKCALWLKNAWSGIWWTRIHATDSSVSQLSRTGVSFSDAVWTTEWQPSQGGVGGTMAAGDRSICEWQ